MSAKSILQGCSHGQEQHHRRSNHKAKRIISRPDEREDGEETEIRAQITVPREGGWGWVVVCTAFLNIFILDGVSYTFGSILHDISTDLKVSESLTALTNSVAVALYFIASPLASALINRYGFRECAMTGSVICSFSLFTSYFTTTFASLCFFYGAVAGFGYSLINLSSGLVVGFYFEKLRSLALSLATCGSSVGVMTLFPVNSYLVKMGGWRTTTLFHSGLFGMIFFLSMSFRPLLSLTVVKTEEDATRTIAYLPSLTTSMTARSSSSRTRMSGLVSTATERLFSAVSNINFPTAAAMVEDGKESVKESVKESLKESEKESEKETEKESEKETEKESIKESSPKSLKSPSQAGLSSSAVSKLTLIANRPGGGHSPQQLKQAESIISRSSQLDRTRANITVYLERPKKRRCWDRLCHWYPHGQQTRPLYRDDAFYDGRIKNLPVYQKSVLEIASETRTGLEYQLAVSRAATTHDLQETRGVFTTAVRRVLATMMDPKLLKKCSFLLLCCSGFMTYLGFLVPYVYLQDRNKQAGIDPKHCNFFISAIGLANACGRLTLGSLATRVDPLKLFALSSIVAGLSTVLSGLSFSLYYQYLYCGIFGFAISSVACLRSVILVSLYGLDKLTNATGMMLIFLGLGNLISTPLAGIIKNYFGYSIAFYLAGTFIMCSGFILIPVKTLSIKENKTVTPTYL